MYKVVIKREGQSNFPIAVLSSDMAISEMLEVIDMLMKNPNVYRMEFYGETIWSERETTCFLFFRHLMSHFDLSDPVQEHSFRASFFGTLTNMAMLENDDIEGNKK